jgi:transcriptional regulator
MQDAGGRGNAAPFFHLEVRHMYSPAHFTETDPQVIAAVLTDHPLATLVAQTDAGLVANHIPLMRDGADVIGHVALANDLHRDLPDGRAVLAIFGAGEAYVSPNWYPSKAATHRAVPTWNYRVVHVHGVLTWAREAAQKRRVVHRLTAMMEGRVNGARGWRMGDAPADYMAGMIDSIVAFRIAITRVQAKSKLSQNRTAEDRAGVVQGLGQGPVVDAMAQDLE